jgi:peptide/nickel transport system substrate-binding protein
MIYSKCSIFLTIVLCIACQNNKKNINHDVFRFNISSGVSSLDPAFAKDMGTTWISGNIYDCLLMLDSQTQLKPMLATHYEISNDGQSYTFYLRNDVFFHKNTCFKNHSQTKKMTAWDVEYSLKRLIDPKVAAPGSWVLNDKVDTLKPFEVLDSFTIRIHLIKPCAPFLNILTMPYCSVIPKEAVDFYGSKFRRNPVGTGPYQFKDWEEGTALFLFKNPNYFMKDKNGIRLPYIDFIKVTFNEQKKMEFLAFMNNDLDMIKDIDNSFLYDVFDKNGNLKKSLSKKYNVYKQTYLNTEYLAILQDTNLIKNNPLSNKEIRQALNMSIHRKELVNNLKNGLVLEANKGFVPVGMPNFDTSFVGFTYDPQKAKAILKKYGYDKNRPAKIQLHINNTYIDLAEFIIYQLNEVGFEVDLKLHPAEMMMQLAKEGKISFFRRSWTADYPDAESHLACFYSKNGAPPNYTRFNNTSYDLLYEAVLASSDSNLRKANFKKMEQILIEESPIVPLFYDQSIRIAPKNIKGIRQNAIHHLDLRFVQKNRN